MIDKDIPVLLSCSEEYDDLFIKVPDELIMEMKDDITCVVYSWLGFNRTYLNFSYINIMDIIKCFYNEFPSRKPILFDRILNSLSYLREEEYLIYDDKDLNNLKYNIVNPSNIIFHTTDKFDPSTDFTIFYYRDFKKIMLNSKPKTLDLNTLVFLYACSFMNFGHNGQPRVFYKSVENASEELGIRRCTIGDALTFLSSAECGVLKRCETFLTQPNVYVLNDETADAEIKKALARLDVNVMPNKSVQKEDDVVDSTHDVEEPTVAKNETTEEEIIEDVTQVEEHKKEVLHKSREGVKLTIFENDEDDNTELLLDKFYGRNIDYEKEFGSIDEEINYFDREEFTEEETTFDDLL